MKFSAFQMVGWLFTVKLIIGSNPSIRTPNTRRKSTQKSSDTPHRGRQNSRDHSRFNETRFPERLDSCQPRSKTRWPFLVISSCLSLPPSAVLQGETRYVAKSIAYHTRFHTDDRSSSDVLETVRVVRRPSLGRNPLPHSRRELRGGTR